MDGIREEDSGLVHELLSISLKDAKVMGVKKVRFDVDKSEGRVLYDGHHNPNMSFPAYIYSSVVDWLRIHGDMPKKEKDMNETRGFIRGGSFLHGDWEVTHERSDDEDYVELTYIKDSAFGR